ncbi:hypothetical protein DN748_06575 [Sinomicrobium soli]|nr:hypothetical protein DN748_06575 [Sinomicrobium sp. N-1-3-6]
MKKGIRKKDAFFVGGIKPRIMDRGTRRPEIKDFSEPVVYRPEKYQGKRVRSSCLIASFPAKMTKFVRLTD